MDSKQQVKEIIQDLSKLVKDHAGLRKAFRELEEKMLSQREDASPSELTVLKSECDFLTIDTMELFLKFLGFLNSDRKYMNLLQDAQKDAEILKDARKKHEKTCTDPRKRDFYVS